MTVDLKKEFSKVLKSVLAHYNPLPTDKPGEAFERARAECLAQAKTQVSIIETLSNDMFEAFSKDNLSKSIDELGLSNRAKTVLIANDILTIGDVMNNTNASLRLLVNLGSVSRMDIHRALNKFGLRLREK